MTKVGTFGAEMDKIGTFSVTKYWALYDWSLYRARVLRAHEGPRRALIGRADTGPEELKGPPGLSWALECDWSRELQLDSPRGV